MENIKYQVSAHCKTRYAERVMGKREKPDAARFVSLNEDKIKTDINKMIEYGSCIYSGRQSQKDGKGKAQVFVNAIKHDFKSKNPTTRWSDIIILK